MGRSDADLSGRAVPSRRAWLALAAVAGMFAMVPALVRRVREASSSAPSHLVLSGAPQALPDLRFTDPNGASTSLASYRGRVVLLNIWATWCPPCREEMPTLDRLQATLGGPNFEVVALSIDEGGLSVVQAFLRRAGIQHLRPYVDGSGDARAMFRGAGVPLTLLIDRDGLEVSRKLGPAVWDHPDVLQVIQGLMG
jgi:thiol-disulfide isomerase/thioredoxin